MDFPEGLRYSTEHEWVRVEGTRATVGITDYAQDALGDVVYVNLPESGAAVVKMASCAEVESTKSVSDIYAP
ncbi:MAG: glycine cleavage system protein H, partial [Acidimicrobiia bacterium]